MNAKDALRPPSPEAAELQEQIRHHNQLYWDQDAPEISDVEYDALVRKLTALWPKAPVLSHMGPEKKAAPAGKDASELERLGTEVVHAHPMLSLDKAYSDEELLKWADKVTGSLVVMPKVDGVACSVTYDAQGNFVLAATRGDGERGDDITVNVRAGKMVPLHIDGGAAEIRGEMYMRRSRFRQAYAENFANPRNLTAGAIKQKDPAKSAAYGLTLAAYDLRGRNLATEEEKLTALAAAGFETLLYHVVDHSQAAAAYVQMAAERQDWDFEADGVVYKANQVSEQDRMGFTAHHPRYALAYKFQGESAQTTLNEIEWSVSRNGTLTPVALIEPVPLSGVTVGRASLHHAGYIHKLGLSTGARILVMRRGDVIPHVEGVVEPGTGAIGIPQQCPSCGAATRLDGEFLFCTAPAACPDALVGTVRHFASVLDIQGLGPKVLRSLFNAGLVKTPANLFRLRKPDLMGLERMGDTLADKLLANIQARRTLPLAQFLTALGIDELGPTVADLVAQHHPSLAALRTVSADELATIHGVGPSIGQALVAGLATRAALLDDLVAFITLTGPAKPVSSNHVLSGKSVVFTGTLARMDRKDAQKKVQALGGKTPSGVTKDLDYLVLGVEKNGAESSKLKTARKLQAAGSALQVMSEDAFLELLNQTAAAS